MDIPELRTVADYQFGAGAGDALFPDGGEPTVHRSRGGRPRQVTVGRGRLVSFGTDGRFTLGLEGGRRLVAALEAPTGRVVVGAESGPYLREGKNAFAKFVGDVDPAVRARDEVAVVDHDDDLLAVGRAELDATAMAEFDSGVAVMVREGADS